MAQQTEFIPYKQALQLKELGFDENYFACYSEDGNLYMSEVWKRKNSIKAPLYQQAFRWFRDKKLCDGSVCRHGEADGGYSYRWDIVHEYGVYEERHFKQGYKTYEEAELACLNKLIEIVKNKQTMAQQTYGEWMISNPPIPNLTAVEWYADKLLGLMLEFATNTITESEYHTKRSKAKEQAKQIEKQQIINAFDIACEDEDRIGEEYYNETYGK